MSLDFPQDLATDVFVYDTDTVLGIGCIVSRDDLKTKIKDLKNRDHFHFIHLISKWDQLPTSLDQKTISILKTYWPGPITFVLNTDDNQTQAYRMPDFKPLIQLIDHVAEPIVSTSCNLSGEPLLTMEEAKTIFGDKVSHFVSLEKQGSKTPSSTIVDLTTPMIPKVLRQGDVKFIL